MRQAGNITMQIARSVGLDQLEVTGNNQNTTALVAGKQPQDVLWPLLRTWTSVVECLPDDDDQSQDWRQVTQELGLLGSGFSERVAALDAYLDNVEELLDEWAIARGIEPGTL